MIIKAETFVRFPSVESSLHHEFINRFVSEIPELKNMAYAILEKLHGTNIQFIFVPPSCNVGEVSVFYATRNKILKPGEKFNNFHGLITEYEDVIDKFCQYSKQNNILVRIYCEYFGRGIQSEVDYGPNKRFRFFGFMLGDEKELRPFSELESLLEELDLSAYIVPVLGYANCLEGALNWEVQIPTAFSPDDPQVVDKNPNNWIEGVVIMPYNDTVVNAGGKRFMLKKKNDWALESGGETKKPQRKIPEDVIELRDEFETYINDNRINSVFSKEGRIEHTKDLSKYIKFIIEDAVDDFMKYHADVMKGLESNDRKFIFNVGGIIVGMLKKHL